MAQLAVLIPARNEVWLPHTVRDVLQHSGSNTEVWVVLDGPSDHVVQLPTHPRLRVIELTTSIGQRAATNLAAAEAKAEYIMKLDAHCSMDEGFDQKLIALAETVGPKAIQVPVQYNLHVFDWICQTCGERTYQGPTPTICGKCEGRIHTKEVVWQRRDTRISEAWRMDAQLHFQYWPEYTRRMKEHNPDATHWDVMTCLGACWFLSTDWYTYIEGLDERHGSWGQMGTELACKTWLAGGRMVLNRTTWFAHLFRTQGGDFSFPYPITFQDQESAREYSRSLWLENKWEKQQYPLQWLIDKFAPVPEWHSDSK